LDIGGIETPTTSGNVGPRLPEPFNYRIQVDGVDYHITPDGKIAPVDGDPASHYVPSWTTIIVFTIGAIGLSYYYFPDLYHGAYHYIATATASPA
jgi:hypothetical protein